MPVGATHESVSPVLVAPETARPVGGEGGRLIVVVVVVVVGVVVVVVVVGVVDVRVVVVVVVLAGGVTDWGTGVAPLVPETFGGEAQAAVDAVRAAGLETFPAPSNASTESR